MSITIQNVSKTFGSYTALSDVSLKVDDGELIALLGPSGSGKTTLLRIVAGLDVPDDDGRSSIAFHGQDVAHRHVAERQVGFVFQHYALFKHMSVYENIAFGLKVRPRHQRPAAQEIRRRVAELLKLIQLEEFGNRFPAQLSGGQRQRVALARALAIEPRVLLLDEPFGALDAKVRQDLRTWLRQLHHRLRMTTILVTHDQEEALEVADRVVVMNRARIEQVGTPEEVFHHPASEFVMDFLGSVNVFRGRIEQGQALLGGIAVALVGGDRGRDVPTANVYARPHELEIERQPAGGAPSLAARISRINPAGPLTRVSLAGAHGGEIAVDLTYNRFRELQLHPGEDVFVVLKHVRAFAPEYCI